MNKFKSTRPPPRGLDFLIRNEQGRWAEDLVINTINAATNFRAVRYGLSRAVLIKGGKEWSKYWEEYQKVEKYGKRPNVLVFKRNLYEHFKYELGLLTSKYGDPSLASEEEWEKYIQRSICAIEVEMSLWKASKMPDRNMKPPLKKINVIAPMIWVKEDDAYKLIAWYDKYKKPIYVVQVFYDLAYVAPLSLIMEKAKRISSARNEKDRSKIMKDEGLLIRKQKFIDERTGVAVEKTVYRLHPTVAKLFGELEHPPEIEIKILEDERGKILLFPKFSGGLLRINPEILSEWEELS